MKLLLSIALLSLSMTTSAQIKAVAGIAWADSGIRYVEPTYTELKTRSKNQDTLLDAIFQRYKTAQDSLADIRSRSISLALMDSADLYILLSSEQVYKKNLDSAIYMIHVANWFINNSQSLLRLGKEWIFSRPKD